MEFLQIQVRAETEYTYPNNAKEIMRIDKWDIKTRTAEVKNNSLFDWRNDEVFKYQLADGIYTGTFNLDEKSEKKQYFVDLGLIGPVRIITL